MSGSATIPRMPFRRKAAAEAKPAPKAKRVSRSKPKPPTPPTFDAPPTLTSDERYAEAAKPAPAQKITDHDEEW